MFTGIVEELGKITKIIKTSTISSLEISCKKILSDIEIGESISVNGICLTVTNFTDKSFCIDVMNETYKKTSLEAIRINDFVNLERALLVSSRFSGHIVTGHIDATGKISSIQRDKNAFIYKIKTTKEVLNLIVKKGSITIDGISLTVVDVNHILFSVSIIPLTKRSTNFNYKKIGDLVNLENDILAKYIKKITENNTNKKDIYSLI